MRLRISRHLNSLLGTLPDEGDAKGVRAALGTKSEIPGEFSNHQSLLVLLYIAAEIEHALMVEYLYAAYSLGGPDVPADRSMEVLQWQEIILGIAKEEMGHLLTVQNLLRCLGGPLNLDRDDYPYDSEFYPFPFRLEPLTRESLAKYICAEAPDNWAGSEADDIRALALQGNQGGVINRVGALYKRMQDWVKDTSATADADFRSSTFPYQANWDEWGRGYRAGARGTEAGGAMPATPELLLIPIASRSDALAAIEAIATQGEANPQADVGSPSHFARFLRIFRAFPGSTEWRPTRDVPIDPTVADQGPQGSLIADEESKLWAHLFNIRYRNLMTNLLHTFEYQSNLSETSSSSPRGLLLHSTFGEMYNIRALSQILVQSPLGGANSTKMAGPPFQMPYTLRMPVDVVDRWRLHVELLRASKLIIERLLQAKNQRHRCYLLALRETDFQTASAVQEILSQVVPKAALKAISLG